MSKVVHALNCGCNPCCEARAAEVRRRLEEQRREAQRVAALEEMAGRGIVFASVKKAQPGTRLAHARRYGRRAS